MTGHAHPITLLTDEIARIFTEMGFDVADGPELEDEWHNFDALNVPRDHPSRDMQDTFWINREKEKDILGRPMGFVLRTHTSGVQVRSMEKWIKEGREFPLAVVVPGKVFRNEATDATHEAQFHQVEGLLIGKDVTLATMKGVLETFFSELFKRDIGIRLRSSFFPFVEPGVEVDMQCFKCGGDGCNICKQTGWIEIMGAGMVHPNVLKNCGIDSSSLQGFAFGAGMDRIAMLKWGLDDVRHLYNGDLRLVNQF